MVWSQIRDESLQDDVDECLRATTGALELCVSTAAQRRHITQSFHFGRHVLAACILRLAQFVLTKPKDLGKITPYELFGWTRSLMMCPLEQVYVALKGENCVLLKVQWNSGVKKSWEVL